jgi:hypothetical protein
MTVILKEFLEGRLAEETEVLGERPRHSSSGGVPTAADRVRARVWSSGIYGRQNGARAGFLRVLRFPLPIFIPPGVGTVG